MMTKEHSGDRLKLLASDYLDLKAADLARLLDIDPQRLNNWFNRGIPAVEMRKVCETLHLRRDYLETGSGVYFERGYDALQLGWQKGLNHISEQRRNSYSPPPSDRGFTEMANLWDKLSEKQKGALLIFAHSIVDPD